MSPPPTTAPINRNPPPVADIEAWLQRVYQRFHHAHLIPPDPLQFVYRYGAPADREIAGLIAALLAYGNVKAIGASVASVLEAMGDSPHAFVCDSSDRVLHRRYAGFRYRFTSEDDLIGLLRGAAAIIRGHGSMGALFIGCDDDAKPDTLKALSGWTAEVRRAAGASLDHLLPDPLRRSACKRLHLYLRWMIRSDSVDPGVWIGQDPARLIVPLDTHLHRAALALGWTRRRQANQAAALDVTAALRTVSPGDPLRYDFALTRPGIRNEPWPQ